MIKLHTLSLKKIIFGAFILCSIMPVQATLLHLRTGYYLAAAGDIGWHNNIVFQPAPGVFNKFFYDIGQGASVSAGVLCGHWRLEAEAAYRKNNLKRDSTQFLSEKATGYTRHFALMVNGYWDVLLPNSWWVIYVGGGAGVSFHRRESAATNTSLGITSNTLFAWQGMTGVSYEIIEHVFLSLGYRLFMTAKPRSSPIVIRANTIVLNNNIELGVRIEF